MPEKKKKFSVSALVLMSLLVAIEIVLSRFLSFSVWNMKIGLAFLPVALAGMLMGPLAAGIVAALADFLGAVLFPIGAYFPGFTLTAFLTGLVFGLFLHNSGKLWRICAASALVQFVLGLFVNSLWISILYGSPYWPLVWTRLGQVAIMLPVQIATIAAMTRLLQAAKLLKKA